MDSDLKRYLKSSLKRTVRKGAKKFLSREAQEELGVVKAKDTYAEDSDFNSFWAPVQSDLLSKPVSEKLKAWVIGFLVFLAVVLMVLILNLTSPDNSSYNQEGENLVVVKGETKNQPKEDESKIELAKGDEGQEVKEVEVTDIVVNPDSTDDIASKSPLLQSKNGSVVEYKVRSGDTLERICVKFYGKYNYDLIQKIKLANKIRNPRSLQIGQKLIIPF